MVLSRKLVGDLNLAYDGVPSIEQEHAGAPSVSRSHRSHQSQVSILDTPNLLIPEVVHRHTESLAAGHSSHLISNDLIPGLNDEEPIRDQPSVQTSYDHAQTRPGVVVRAEENGNVTNQRDPVGRIARWAIRMQQYEFDIVHRPGKSNVVPDALSRAVPVLEEPFADQIGAVTEAKDTPIKDKWYLKQLLQVTEHPERYPLWMVDNEREVQYSGDPPDLPGTTQGVSVYDDPTAMSEAIRKVFSDVQKRLSEAYVRSRHAYNLRRRDDRFQLRQSVWKRNYVLSDATKKFTAKLAPKFSGPFTITRVLSPWTYELTDSAGRCIGTWHAKDLKAHPPDAAVDDPPPDTDDTLPNKPRLSLPCCVSGEPQTRVTGPIELTGPTAARATVQPLTPISPITVPTGLPRTSTLVFWR
ncbi:hypothetical protein NQ317_012045 [Molorchus minor]|uniref:Uncharacterized protein n=1 Tax=Molorchus minor TaxID=1323400 RepID=A0ABQ9JKV9_9CUCU|nr:hypothetical protein NQ317_012045 [Molorchus minor]